MKNILILITLLNLSGLLIAQNLYDIPFASKNNTIELEIKNLAFQKTEQVYVRAVSVPDWINIPNYEHHLSAIRYNDNATARFDFSVNTSAPVMKEEAIIFEIKCHGHIWYKIVMIRVMETLTFKLHQNYPNPFNPETTIEYQLPRAGKVKLDIYNNMGQKVSTLINARQEAGFHKETWNASSFSSGMYFYQMIYHDDCGNEMTAGKKMIIIK